MRLKQLQFIIFCLLCSSTVVGQKLHELKIDFPASLNQKVIPSYELVLSDKIGVEVSLGFNFSDLVLSNYDLQNLERFEFSALRINPSILGKYYLSSKKKFGYGLFVGPYFMTEYLVNREDGYVMKFEEIWSTTASERLKIDKGIRTISYGLNFGYKWIIKSHFLIELTPVLYYDQPVGIEASTQSRGFVFDASLKLGYRF